MATKKSTKAGTRKARASDRAIAAELVRCYRTGEPWREHKEFGTVFEFPVDAEFFAQALELFAEHGTFEPPTAAADAALRRGVRVLGVAYLQARGRTAKQATAEVAERHGRHKQTVADANYGRKKRAT